MKVLHIWDVACVALTLTKFMNRLYNITSHIMIRRIFDPFRVYNKYAYDDSAEKFIIRALIFARRFDLIHVHSLDRPLFFNTLRDDLS